MKLLRCYIENYGTLSKFQLEFQDGLTVINEDNGFGKSTVASFIKAMFYGLPQTAKRKASENERKLRTPWQGGNFGGILEAEIKGKQYRIERFFGAKANADTFRLFDLSSGAESADYSENIGIEVFGIDAEGFERSVFFPQLESETFANTSITAKLMDLVENNDDINNYDKAMDRLKKRKNDYLTGRGKGIIPELQSLIDDTESRLNDGRVAIENISELTRRANEYKALISQDEQRLADVRDDLKKASEQVAIDAANKRRIELMREIDEVTAKAEQIKNVYPNGLPEEAVLKESLLKAQELSVALNEYQLLTADSSDMEALKELEEFFGGNEFEAQELEAVRRKVNELSELTVKVNAKAELLKTVKIEEKPAKKPPLKLLCVISAVLLIAGCVLLIKTVAAVVVLLAGVSVGAAAAFLYLKGMIMQNAPKADIAGAKTEYEALSTKAEALTDELNGFFDRFESEGSFTERLYQLSDKLDRLKKVKKSVEQREERIAAKKHVISEITAELNKVFKDHSVSTEGVDYREELFKMRDAGKSLAEWNAMLADRRQRLAEVPKAESAEAVQGLNAEALAVEEKTLGSQIDGNRRLLLEMNSRIMRLRPTADAVPELENDLASLKDTLAEKEQELFTIEKTMEFLEIARAALSNKYRDTMSEGFKKYADMMLGSSIGGFLLDSELNVNIERYGKAQDKECFSTGYKNLIDIATRFALIDALYLEEKPPVILDDPFVNFDEQKLENALKLLDELAADRQIVYLTCHASRVPK